MKFCQSIIVFTVLVVVANAARFWLDDYDGTAVYPTIGKRSTLADQLYGKRMRRRYRYYYGKRTDDDYAPSELYKRLTEENPCWPRDCY